MFPHVRSRTPAPPSSVGSRSALALCLASLVTLLLALPALAGAAPLTAKSFDKRQGRVTEIAGGGGRQARLLALTGRARASAPIRGPRFDGVVARLRTTGPRCRGARVSAGVEGRAMALTTPGRRWRAFRLRATPSPGRHTLRLRLRSRAGCRLLFDEANVRLVRAPAAPAAPRPRTTPVELGAAIDSTVLFKMPGYAQLFVDNFATMTPENEMKMYALQPKRGEFDFATADGLVDWARSQGKQVRGHTLVFAQQLPGWLTAPTVIDRLQGNGPPDRAELLRIMREHITTVMRHYAGRVREWDVVNEALRPDGSYKPGFWLDTIGPEYVEEAFRAARAAVPGAKLCYNEIGGEVAGPLADAIFKLAEGLKAQGLIDCIGFQSHTNAATPPTQAQLEQNLTRFATLGLELHMSEVDVSVSELPGDTPSRFATQAQLFNDASLACFRVPACTRFTTWGMTDAASWLGDKAMPLPFDVNLAPKPAWDAIQRGLSGRGPAGPAR